MNIETTIFIAFFIIVRIALPVIILAGIGSLLKKAQLI